MAALLVLMLAAAWVEDGLLRRFVDPALRRRALVDGVGFAFAGIALAACVLELLLPSPVPLARAALHALALVLTGFALAAEDAARPARPPWGLAREAAPLVVAPALAIVVGALVPATGFTVRGAMQLAAWTNVLVFVRTIAPALEARIATATNDAWPMRSAWLASAALLALGLLGARAWLP